LRTFKRAPPGRVAAPPPCDRAITPHARLPRVNENKKDPMEVDPAIKALNAALRLQHRSAIAYTHLAGRLVGFQFYGLAAEMRRYALEELDDARRLVEKIATLGGDATLEIAPIELKGDAEAVVHWLIDAETEAIEALQDVIPTTGQQGRSEAMEHRLEHIIMRKQEQVDVLIRASGGAQ
jgi:bacterioferritin (cytochrome b1)